MNCPDCNNPVPPQVEQQLAGRRTVVICGDCARLLEHVNGELIALTRERAAQIPDETMAQVRRARQIVAEAVFIRTAKWLREATREQQEDWACCTALGLGLDHETNEQECAMVLYWGDQAFEKLLKRCEDFYQSALADLSQAPELRPPPPERPMRERERGGAMRRRRRMH